MPVSDYALLCKRSKTSDGAVKVRCKRGPLNVAVDLIGFNVYGKGVRKEMWKRALAATANAELDSNSTSRSPSTWAKFARPKRRKNYVDDAAVALCLHCRIPGKIECFLGDSAYDKRKVYRALSTRNIQTIIPPQIDAIIDKTESYGTAGNIVARRFERGDAWFWTLGNVGLFIVVVRWGKTLYFG